MIKTSLLECRHSFVNFSVSKFYMFVRWRIFFIPAFSLLKLQQHSAFYHYENLSNLIGSQGNSKWVIGLTARTFWLIFKMAARERRMGSSTTLFLLSFLVFFDIVISFNVDVTLPYIFTNSDSTSFFGYSISMQKSSQR